MHCTLEPIDDPDAIAARWKAVEVRARPSMFQSWGWIGTWLRTLRPAATPMLLSVRDGRDECGVAVVCRRRRRRHRWLVSNGLFLNETGDPALDTLTVEFNGVLAVSGMEGPVAGAAMRHLVAAEGGWDELYLSGILCTLDYAGLASAAGLTPRLVSSQPCDYVDLDALRARGGDFLATLSKNTRYQVRRALRRYEERGALDCRVADTLDGALDDFDRLKALHQRYWEGRGHAGAFANPDFERFHRAYIADRFAAGEIQLVRVAAGNDVIGYLYNILHDGHVYSYQSGFAYEDDAAIKPGLVSHYLAVCDALARGARLYDFMAGAAQHKKSLGTDRREMVWIVAQKPRIKFAVEDLLRGLRQRVRRRLPD